MIARLRSAIPKSISWYLLLSFLLFATSIYILTSVLSRQDRAIHLDFMRLIVLLGALYASAISAFRRSRPFLLSLLSFFSGVIITFAVVGDLLAPFISYLRALSFHLFSRLVQLFNQNSNPPDPEHVRTSWDLLTGNVAVLRERLFTWLGTLPEAAYDPVSLNLVWGILLWLTTVWVFWYVIKRRQALIGYLPPLVIIASVNSSLDSGLFWLALILGIGLLLAVLGKQAKLEEYWKKHKLSVSELILRRTGQIALYLSAGLVLFAIGITSPELEDFIDEIRERRQRAQTSDVAGESEEDLALLEEEEETGPDEILNETADGWLPNVHLIGNNPELAEIEVFHAEVQGQYIVPGQRHYFRSANYETYSLRGWYNQEKEYYLIPPETDFEIDFTLNEQLLYQEVSLLRDFPDGNLMYVVGELTAANVPYYGSFHTKFVNNTYTDMFASVTGETYYVAYSIVPFFGEDDLRATTQEYPNWIANKYLQVPEFVSERTFDLALSLTATEPTPYDRALAIESYLRQIEYTLDVPSPPKNRDIVEYFLFELEQGYCDYYASAMVVLARAAGIPARMATGYLVSTYDPETSNYIVTADQAHSWAELFFPEYGWVTFEPTAGQPALNRSLERETPPENLALEPEFEQLLFDDAPEKFTLVPQNLFMLAGELIILAAIISAAYHWIESKVLAAMDSEQMLTRVYHKLRRRTNRLGITTTGTQTPIEFASALTQELEELRAQKPYDTILRTTPEKAALILRACNQAAYSTHQPSPEQLDQVIAIWGTMRWQFILAGFFLRFEPVRATVRRVWFRLQQPA